jgi:PmbA protein
MHSHLQGHPSLIEAVRRLERLNPDQFELYFQRRTSTDIESKDQKVESLSRAEDVGMAVRLIKDKKMGFSFTTSLEKEAIQRAVEFAFEVASHMPEDDHLNLFSFGSAVYPDVDAIDVKGLAVPVSEKIELAKALEATCRGSDARIKGVRSASISENRTELHLVDSNGEHIHFENSLFTASISCKAEQDGESQMGGDFAFSNYFDNLDVQTVAKTAAIRATELLGAKVPSTMQCPAVLRNNVVTDLLDFLSSSFSAEEMSKGRSMLQGKQGERVFSEAVTLVDDGLMSGGYGTSPFDSEGVPSSRNVLVDGGFFKQGLYDLYYAKKLGCEPTGNASRGIKTPPSIHLSNLFMQKGKKAFNSLFDGITKGVMITDLMGVHTANPVTGDFSLGASGILIENGKLTLPVKGFAVAGNVLDVFRKITDISNDLRFFGSVGAPSVRLSDLSVGGT